MGGCRGASWNLTLNLLQPVVTPKFLGDVENGERGVRTQIAALSTTAFRVHGFTGAYHHRTLVPGCEGPALSLAVLRLASQVV